MRSRLVERDRELATIGGALDRTRVEGVGGALLIEGPAGIGKTALLGELRERASAAGMRVLRARGSEMEREFGFGVVRQLFGSVLRALSSEQRARLFAGPAALAAAIFGIEATDAIDVGATKRIFWTKGPDLTVIIGSYGCGGPSCGVSTEGKAKGSQAAGLTFSLDRAKAHPKHKPTEVVVGKGKTTIPGGRSGPVKMRLTKAGVKLLEQKGSLEVAVTVTVTIPGRKATIEHRQVSLAVKAPKKPKKK